MREEDKKALRFRPERKDKYLTYKEYCKEHTEQIKDAGYTLDQNGGIKERTTSYFG